MNRRNEFVSSQEAWPAFAREAGASAVVATSFFKRSRPTWRRRCKTAAAWSGDRASTWELARPLCVPVLLSLDRSAAAEALVAATSVASPDFVATYLEIPYEEPAPPGKGEREGNGAVGLVGMYLAYVLETNVKTHLLPQLVDGEERIRVSVKNGTHMTLGIITVLITPSES